MKLGTGLHLKQKYLIFWSNFAQKGGTSVLKQKTEYHKGIENTQITLGTKFNLRQKILIFFDRICLKRVEKFQNVKFCEN